ncbi:junctophilin-1 isoform X1 [Papilio machaon]|uniref:junctophilin-1 isoform X1 n=1 Tax=Papilio machaon TaxID=76193 RepID=UPI001E6633E4|nr:junctophilin-1 isoform X1 [Papilio machaon]
MQPNEPAETAHAAGGNPPQRGLNGGRFDFDDGGTYCGGWEDGKAHGHGVCTGPKGQGAYSGSWHFGFEVSGVYTWPSGSAYEGQWQNGKRHGLGVETRDRWLYRGEWTQGCKGRYGVRQSTTSNAKYEGTWANGYQDGYGSETYADGGTYQGQWMRGHRHGYGVRTSAPFGLASHNRGGARDRGSLSSLVEALGTPDPSDRRNLRVDDARGGFVLQKSSDEPAGRRGSIVEKTKKGLFPNFRKRRSTGELDKRGTGSVRSGGSAGSASSWVSSVESSHSTNTRGSHHTHSNTSFIVEDEHLDPSVTETYMGEWKNDKRTGFGVCERTDGLRYEGEWLANRKYGYGVTTFRDGTREEGKYKNNVLITSQKRKHMFLMRSAKFRERVDSAVNAAQRASKIALQKADIAISRTATARGKAEQADESADQAKEDCDIAQTTAKQFAPDFKHPGFDRIRLRDRYRQKTYETQSPAPVLQESENILEGKSIPNHIPPTHSQLPQANKIPNAMNSRRPSTQYPKAMPPMDPRLANSTNYGTDDRTLGPPYDPYYNSNKENWGSPSNSPAQIQDKQRQYMTNEPSSGYSVAQPGGPQPSSIAYRRRDSLQPQQSVDQTSQQYPNQGRRPSVRPTMNQRAPPQEWNPTHGIIRRQSILAQPTNDPQSNTYVDPGTASYGRNELRTGVFHSDGTHEHQRPAVDAQGHRQGPDTQVYQQGSLDQQGYRQSDQQTYRQPMSDHQQYRQQNLPPEQDIVNGEREPRPFTARPSIDYFDHYKRPPSRDSSVDRYGRRSRQPSVEAAPPGGGSRSGSIAPQPLSSSRPPSRAATPAGNGHLASGRGSRAASREPQGFEDSLLRKRTLGQEITPSPYQPKRTESLYVAQNATPPPPAPMAGGGGGRKDWFSRQQLVILVLFINISLGIMFFKLLT